MSEKMSSSNLLDAESDTGDYEYGGGGSRMCVGGFPKKRCICFIVLAVLAVLICMAFPIMFMGVAPSLAQSAVSSTKIALYNSHITQWVYPINDTTNINVCDSYHPKYLTIIQDILFYDIPGFASLSPAWIMPSTADLYYEGVKFGTLSLPMIDLSHPEGGKKWANGTSCLLAVTDDHQFLVANEKILPGIGQGWVIWNQKANVVMKQNTAGIISYFGAVMDQNVNVTEPSFEAGPMSGEIDFFEALMCTAPSDVPATGADDAAAPEAEADVAASTTEAAAETTEAAAETTETAAETTEAAPETTEAAPVSTSAAAKPTSSKAAAKPTSSSAKPSATSSAKPSATTTTA